MKNLRRSPAGSAPRPLRVVPGLVMKTNVAARSDGEDDTGIADVDYDVDDDVDDDDDNDDDDDPMIIGHHQLTTYGRR